MQAVFSGVKYGERAVPIKAKEKDKLAIRELEELTQRLNGELQALKLIASKNEANSKGISPKKEAVNAVGNTETFKEIKQIISDLPSVKPTVVSLALMS